MKKIIDVKDFFADYSCDGNDWSFDERVNEIAKLGFPIELIGLIVNDEQELSKLLETYFRKEEEDDN
jgi:hypothetical protein